MSCNTIGVLMPMRSNSLVMPLQSIQPMKSQNELSEIAKELGKRGGQKTASLHGKKHFSAAGKKGMEKRWKEQRKKATGHKEP